MGNINGRPRGRAPKPEIVLRENSVIRLREEGWTWGDIAKEVGYGHPATARDAYMRGINRVSTEDIDNMRHLEAERLDAIQVGIWDQATSGDLKAVNVLLKIIDRRCVLYGLYQKPGAADAKAQQRASEPAYDTKEIDSLMLWLQVSAPLRKQWEAFVATLSEDELARLRDQEETESEIALSE